MMPFKKPSFEIEFDLDDEIKALDLHREDRGIPSRAADKVLVATWNLANFGLQHREERHLRLMANVISSFDIIALQEIADDINHLEKILSYLPANYDCIFSDIGGNDERGAYIYDAARVTQKGLIAELVIKSNRSREIEVTVGDVIEKKVFDDFNRNPYMVSFTVKKFDFTLVNVHLYWSSEFIRAAEVNALAGWAAKRSKLAEFRPPSKDIMLLGDFNMPSFADDDPIYSPAVKQGLYAPLHETNNTEGSNLAGDMYYDQLFFLPKHTKDDYAGKIGVFDFDNALFKNFWRTVEDNKSGRQKYHQYVRYYLSDHRPLWAQFDV